MDMDIEAANREAIQRLLAAQPFLVGVATAREVIPGMKENLLLHAGPPVAWSDMSGPMRGAVIGALLYEGLAASEAEAQSMVERGEVEFAPCHHHRSVGPMAGVTSASMPVYVVENRATGNQAYSTLNEGYGKVLRYGAYSPDVLERLAWLRDVAGPALGEALARSGGIDLKSLIGQALHMGDEGHNRNKAGSALYTRLIAPHLAAVERDGDRLHDILAYLGGNDLAVLNPVMAACKAVTDAAHGIPGSTLVTTMARNGTEFGIRVSGLGDRWFTAPSAVPQGLYFPGYSAADAAPDIGDSTITETAGIGAFAMAAAPAIVNFISGTPKDALNATLSMYEITLAENDAFTIPFLDFRGSPTGIDIRRVVETGIVPRVNTGIAHREAGVGQIGAGLVDPPMSCFVQALEAMVEALD